MGKARLFSDSSNDEVYQSETNNENFVLGSQQNAQGLGGGVFNDSSGYGNFQQSGRDQRNADLNGALFLGNLGFALDTAVLDVTTSTLNLLEDASSNPLPRTSIDKIVTLSAGSTSDLITILGAQRTGQRLRLYNIDTNTITIKNTGAAIDNTIFTPGADDFVLSGNEVVDLTYDITTAKWRVVGGVGSGGAGISFPILYPKEDLTPAIDGTATIDVSLETGNAKQIQFPAGNISFEITGDPANTVGEDFYVVFIQDSVGDRSLTSVDSRIKDGSLMNVLLDKAPLAHTLFRIATLGGGTVYHPILINLSTSTSTFLSTLAIDTDKDWAGRFITNLAGLDLFANSVANDITNMGGISFVSNVGASRGQFGRSEFFEPTIVPVGLATNIPNTANITWTIDGTEKFRLDAPNTKLISSIDLDMNTFDIFNIDQARFILDSGSVSADTDSVILLNNNTQFQFNTSQNNDFVFSLQNIPALIIDRNVASSDQVIVTIQSDDTNPSSTANLNLTRTSEPGINFQEIGQIGFRAPDDTNTGTLEYVAIVAKIESAATGFIDGSLRFDITQAGALVTPFLTMNDGSNGIIDALRVLDMNSNDILNVDRLQMSGGTPNVTSVNDVVWYLDSEENLVSNVNATDNWIWTSGNEIKMILSDSTLEKRDVIAPVFQLYNTRVAATGTAGSISILANSDDISIGIAMGFIFADTEVTGGDGRGSLKLGVNLSGTPTALLALNDSDNGLIDFFTDLEMNDFALFNVSSISISDNISSDVHGLLQGLDSVGVRLTLTAGEQFNIFDNITNIFQMDSTTGLQLFTNDLTMGTGGNIVAGGATEGMTNIGQLEFVDNTQTPIALLAIFSDGTDIFANTGGTTVNLSDIGGEFFGPWTANHDAGNFTLNNISALSITDSVGGVHGLLQGLASTGVRLTLTAGEQFNIFDNITNIFQMDSTTGLQLFGNDLTMGTGANIVAGGATEGMTNIGHLDFIDNTQTPSSSLSIFSDGTDIFANTGSTTVNLSDIGGGGEFFGPWTANHDAGNFTLNDIAALSITDSSGNVHGLLQGLIGTGVRLTLTSGDQFEILDNITDIFQVDSTGLDLFGNDLDTVATILFEDANNPAQSGAVPYIGFDTVNMLYNVPSGEFHVFSQNNTTIANFGSAGLTISGTSTINMTSSKITSLADPTVAQDAATKAYVDAQGTDIDGIQDVNIWTNSDSDAEFEFEVYHSNSKQGRVVTDAVTRNDDTIEYYPIFIGERARIADIGFNLAATATGNISLVMGLYSNRATDSSGRKNYPEDKIVEVSTLSGTTAGAKSFFITNTNIEAGLYWIAFLFTAPNTLFLNTYGSEAANSVGHYFNDDLSPSQFLPIFGYSDNGSTTSLPTTATDNMPAIVVNPLCVFARFIPNTSP